MKITIETLGESYDVAMALAKYIRCSLKQAGYLQPQIDEDPYYTSRRALMHQLISFGEGYRSSL